MNKARLGILRGRSERDGDSLNLLTEMLRRLAQSLERPRARRFIMGAFVLIATALTFLPPLRYLRSGTSTDYRVWFEAGRALLEHRELYPRNENFPFMYPPSCAALVALPSVLAKGGFIFLLALCNSVAWAFCLGLITHLVSGSERVGRTLLIALPSAILSVYIWSTYHLGQPSLVLLAMLLGGFVCLRSRRFVWAGALIAVAAGIKAFPILALPYLIYRRYWMAIVALVLTLAGLLFLLPLPWRGPAETMADFQVWRGGMLRYQDSGIAQRQTRGYSWKNQSIFGLANRMLRRISADESDIPLYANIANFDWSTVNAVIGIFALLTGVSFLVVMPWATRPETLAWEFSALLILILLFTPLAFGYLFVWLMLPLALLLRQLLRENDAIAGTGLIVSILLLAVTAVAPRYAQIYGSVFFAALTLYVTIAVELWRAKSKVRPPDAAGA